MRSITAFTVGQLLINAGGRAIVALLIGVAALIAGSGLCQAQTPITVKCPPTGILPPGTGQNLLVDSKCRVGGGIYHYNNVNIVNGGQLLFTEGGTMNLPDRIWRQPRRFARLTRTSSRPPRAVRRKWRHAHNSSVWRRSRTSRKWNYLQVQ